MIATELFDEGMDVVLSFNLHFEDKEKIVNLYGALPYKVVSVCPEQDTVCVLTARQEIVVFYAALLEPYWN